LFFFFFILLFVIVFFLLFFSKHLCNQFICATLGFLGTEYFFRDLLAFAFHFGPTFGGI
jgi:hypothetical protein